MSSAEGVEVICSREAHAGDVGTPESPYAVSLDQFEREVSVPRSQRGEVVGGAPEPTLLSGDDLSGEADGDGD